MGFITWVNSIVKKAELSWVDEKLLQLCGAGFVLMIAKLWEPLLSLDWYWYAVIGVLAGIKPTYKAFGK